METDGLPGRPADLSGAAFRAGLSVRPCGEVASGRQCAVPGGVLPVVYYRVGRLFLLSSRYCGTRNDHRQAWQLCDGTDHGQSAGISGGDGRGGTAVLSVGPLYGTPLSLGSGASSCQMDSILPGLYVCGYPGYPGSPGHDHRPGIWDVKKKGKPDRLFCGNKRNG